MATWDVDRIRSCFPALSREVDGQPAAFFDGPAGSQVPQRVIDAVALYLRDTNANHGGCFATSRESDAMLATARSRFAAFLGAGDADFATTTAKLAADMPANGPRQHYARAVLEASASGERLVRPVKSQDSSLIAALARSNALIVQAPHAPRCPAGTDVEVLLLDF